MKVDKKKLGDFGEEIVSNYLKKKGFLVLSRNFKCRFGEIDLIVRKGGVISFVEVKSRRKAYFNISEVINKKKRDKIILTAKDFLVRNDLCAGLVYRFDVAILFQEDSLKITSKKRYSQEDFEGELLKFSSISNSHFQELFFYIKYIENAFTENCF